MHELTPRNCFKIRLGNSPDEYAVLCRIKAALGDRFYVRKLDDKLSGFVIPLLEQDLGLLCEEDRNRVELMRDEGIERDCAPLVWRFLEDQYIEEFFSEGKLRLSTFNRCKKLEASRADSQEGNAGWYNMHGRKFASLRVGDNAFLLCTSLSPFAANPKSLKNLLFIKDLQGLTREITRAIRAKGFDVCAIVEGPCTYSSRCFMTEDVYQRTDENLHKLFGAPGDRLYFAKDARPSYMHEWEYRVLWLTGAKELPECLDIKIEHPECYAQRIPVPSKAMMYVDGLKVASKADPESYCICIFDLQGQKDFFKGITSSNVDEDTQNQMVRITEGFQEIVRYVKSRYSRCFDANDAVGVELFSDSLMLSIKDDPLRRSKLLTWLSILVKVVFIGSKYQLPFRGGLACGKARLSTSGSIYGFPVHEAIEIEGRRADYPRVVLSQELAKRLLGDPDFDPFVTVDSDSAIILDYASPELMNRPEFVKEAGMLTRIEASVNEQYQAFCLKNSNVGSGEVNFKLARRYRLWLEYLQVEALRRTEHAANS